MPTVIAIDPVTRLEGHLKVEVTIDGPNKTIVDAKATGTLFRGFENLLVNRDPWDAPHITQRICGVCPIPHGMAAVQALEQAAGKTVPANGRILRNLVLGANFVQSHLLHFYHLALLDFVVGPAMSPWNPGWDVDRRIAKADNDQLFNNYKLALTMTRKGHEMGAVFGGRMPHSPAFIPGGFTATPTSSQINQFRAYGQELLTFINTVYLKDVEYLAGVYPDYASLGRGHGNLMAFGVFDLDAAGKSKLLRPGIVHDGSKTVENLDIAAINEQVTHSWYDASTDNLPPATGITKPVYPKTDGYSWLKAPRYNGQPFEAGPLARMWINGDYTTGISIMDRHRARALETKKIALAMQEWLKQIVVGGAVYSDYTTPANAKGVGLTEAPRGALGHWVSISNGKIANYQVITPTCWNGSPRDKSHQLGPIEEALIGMNVSNADQPIEVLRLIHSYDPCLSCAVHVIKPSAVSRVKVIDMAGILA